MAVNPDELYVVVEQISPLCHKIMRDRAFRGRPPESLRVPWEELGDKDRQEIMRTVRETLEALLEGGYVIAAADEVGGFRPRVTITTVPTFKKQEPSYKDPRRRS